MKNRFFFPVFVSFKLKDRKQKEVNIACEMELLYDVTDSDIITFPNFPENKILKSVLTYMNENKGTKSLQNVEITVTHIDDYEDEIYTIKKESITISFDSESEGTVSETETKKFVKKVVADNDPKSGLLGVSFMYNNILYGACVSSVRHPVLDENIKCNVDIAKDILREMIGIKKFEIPKHTTIYDAVIYWKHGYIWESTKLEL